MWTQKMFSFIIHVFNILFFTTLEETFNTIAAEGVYFDSDSQCMTAPVLSVYGYIYSKNVND